LFGMTSIVPRTVGADSISARGALPLLQTSRVAGEHCPPQRWRFALFFYRYSNSPGPALEPGLYDFMAIPHNSKCRYGERGAAAAKPKCSIILCVLSSILATQMPCRSRRSGA